MNVEPRSHVKILWNPCLGPHNHVNSYGVWAQENLVVINAHTGAHAHVHAHVTCTYTSCLSWCPHQCRCPKSAQDGPETCLKEFYIFSGMKSKSSWWVLALSNQEPGSSKKRAGDLNMRVDGFKMAQRRPPGEPKMPPQMWHMFVKIMCPILVIVVP